MRNQHGPTNPNPPVPSFHRSAPTATAKAAATDELTILLANAPTPLSHLTASVGQTWRNGSPVSGSLGLSTASSRPFTPGPTWKRPRVTSTRSSRDPLQPGPLDRNPPRQTYSQPRETAPTSLSPLPTPLLSPCSPLPSVAGDLTGGGCTEPYCRLTRAIFPIGDIS